MRMPAESSASVPLIAALRAGPGSNAGAVLAAFALRRRAEGVTVAGVVEPPGEAGHAYPAHGEGHGGCGGALVDLSSGERIGLHQDLGPGSEACNLDTSQLARACAAAERAIAAGAALVVLNRFGGQEASARGWLMAAFQAAVAAGIPVACSVAPRAEAVWEDFAAGCATWLPAEAEALEAWWQGHAEGTRRRAAA
jgi:hypothetical protein